MSTLKLSPAQWFRHLVSMVSIHFVTQPKPLRSEPTQPGAASHSTQVFQSYSRFRYTFGVSIRKLLNPSLNPAPKSHSTQAANRPNMVIITFVCISCKPSQSMPSLTATNRICFSIIRSTIIIIGETLRPRRLSSLTSIRHPLGQVAQVINRFCTT